MSITNRDRLRDVDFLPPDQFKIIGDVEGITLVLIGKEQGSDAPVVAKARTNNPAQEDLFAVPLYELLNHSFGGINIVEEL